MSRNHQPWVKPCSMMSSTPKGDNRYFTVSAISSIKWQPRRCSQRCTGPLPKLPSLWLRWPKKNCSNFSACRSWTETGRGGAVGGKVTVKMLMLRLFVSIKIDASLCGSLGNGRWGSARRLWSLSGHCLVTGKPSHNGVTKNFEPCPI